MTSPDRSERAAFDQVEPTRQACANHGAPGIRTARSAVATLRFSVAEIELLRQEFEASAAWRDMFVGVNGAANAP